MDQKLSKQIIQQAREQQNDEELLEAEENLDNVASAMAGASFEETRLHSRSVDSDEEVENDGDEIILSGTPEDGGAFYKSLVIYWDKKG